MAWNDLKPPNSGVIFRDFWLRHTFKQLIYAEITEDIEQDNLRMKLN